MASAPEGVFKPTRVRTREGRVFAVREYNSEDFGALVGMYKSFIPKRVAQGLPPPDVPRIAHWLDRLQQRGRGFLARDDRRIVGHTILCPISTSAVEFTIFVHQAYRGQGLGTELTRATLEFAAKLGFTEVFLTTQLSNLPALRLYREVGFQVMSVFGEECEMRLALASVGAVHHRAA